MITAEQSKPAVEGRGARAGARKRIAYVQYTNPAGYPPLEHSSLILAEAGWDVLFLGSRTLGADSLRFPAHSRVRVKQLSLQESGWRQKVHYLFFCGWCLAWILRNRTTWVYASDLFSCPVGAVASTIFRIPLVYHEHDHTVATSSVFLRMCAWTRAVCARRAKVCIVPNGERAALFAKETLPPRPPAVVWNCPRRDEVSGPHHSVALAPTRFLFHGSIGPDRLPLTVIDALAALPGAASLTVVGYETVGSVGYREALRRRAVEQGIEHRLTLIDPLNRHALLEVCRTHDVGLALLPFNSKDINVRAMTGASNKPFEYLSGGLALLVSQLSDWEEMFVKPGYALGCDPLRLESVQSSLRWFIEHPEETRAMGEKGRQRIFDEWNYESQFQPALKVLQETGSPLVVKNSEGSRS